MISNEDQQPQFDAICSFWSNVKNAAL
jgi:hypothetical protein